MGGDLAISEPKPQFCGPVHSTHGRVVLSSDEEAVRNEQPRKSSAAASSDAPTRVSRKSVRSADVIQKRNEGTKEMREKLAKRRVRDSFERRGSEPESEDPESEDPAHRGSGHRGSGPRGSVESDEAYPLRAAGSDTSSLASADLNPEDLSGSENEYRFDEFLEDSADELSRSDGEPAEHGSVLDIHALKYEIQRAPLPPLIAYAFSRFNSISGTPDCYDAREDALFNQFFFKRFWDRVPFVVGSSWKEHEKKLVEIDPFFEMQASHVGHCELCKNDHKEASYRISINTLNIPATQVPFTAGVAPSLSNEDHEAATRTAPRLGAHIGAPVWGADASSIGRGKKPAPGFAPGGPLLATLLEVANVEEKRQPEHRPGHRPGHHPEYSTTRDFAQGTLQLNDGEPDPFRIPAARRAPDPAPDCIVLRTGSVCGIRFLIAARGFHLRTLIFKRIQSLSLDSCYELAALMVRGARREFFERLGQTSWFRQLSNLVKAIDHAFDMAADLDSKSATYRQSVVDSLDLGRFGF